MKKKILTGLLIVICVLLITALTGWYFAVDIIGEKVFETMVESVDEETLEKTDELFKHLPKNEKEEYVEKTDENTEKEKNEKTNKTEEKSVKTEKIAGMNVEFADKQAALNLAYSKFSQAEINAGLAKLQRGLTKEEYNYYISLAKSRFTQAEIEQIKAWYYKYR